MSLTPRSFIVLLVIGCSLGVFQRTEAQSPPPGAKTQSDTVDFNANGEVEIDNRTGSITVTTWDRAKVGYEVTLAPAEGDSVVTTGIDIHHTEEEMSFDHDHSWSLRIPGLLTISPDGDSEPIGHYRIVMPRTAGLEIDDYASTIQVTDLRANADIDSHQGSVTIRGVEGTLALDTFSGTAEAMELRGRVNLETHSGRLTAAFEEFSGPSIAETYSGDLRLFLPSNTGFGVEMNADSSQFTIDEAFGTPSRDGDRWIYNGGGPNLSADTFSGTIELHPLDADTTSSR